MKHLIYIFLSSLFLSCQIDRDQMVTNYKDTLIVTNKDSIRLKDSVVVKELTVVNYSTISLDSLNTNLNKNIGDRPLKVALLLEIASKFISEGKTRYNWREGSSCNMGIIVQLATNKTPIDISIETENYPLPKEKYNEWTWSGFTSQYCPLTGKRLPLLFDALLKAGFQRDDVYHIEYCDDKRILLEGKFDKSCFSDSTDHYQNSKLVAKYMATWAKMIRKFNENKVQVRSKTTYIQQNDLAIDTTNGPEIGMVNNVDQTSFYIPNPINIIHIDSLVTSQQDKTVKVKRIKEKKFKNGNICP
jgi:hypothetical protein